MADGQIEKTQVILHIYAREAGLTHILRRAQDLPDFCEVVHASGQAKVHDADVPERSGTGQQDVLGLEKRPNAQVRQRYSMLA